MNQELQYLKEWHLKLTKRMDAHGDKVDEDRDEAKALMISMEYGNIFGLCYLSCCLIYRKFKKLKRKFEK